ncbi:aspartic peptidase domain-containing protein [Aspergillus carlsbadensis]|nr:aspartic peptidase domain-containing protein [Aspergillus carlsbadensis]
MHSPAVLLSSRFAGGYWINVSVGTPPQPLSMLFNVNKVGSTLMYPVLAQPPCTDECQEAARFGSFDPSRSSTYEPVTGGADVWDSEMYMYSEGSDIFTIGGAQATGPPFRLVPLADEFSAVNEFGWHGTTYKRLVDQGLIISSSMSMWNTPETNEAGVLFGGINTAKYHGPLHCFPMDIAFSGSNPRVTLPVSGVDIQLGNGTSQSDTTTSYDFPESHFGLRTDDTSRSVTYIPRSAAMRLYADLGVSYDSLYRRVRIPCSWRMEDHTLIFKIGNTTIPAPWTAFVSEEPEDDSDLDSDIESGNTCSFNIHPMQEPLSDKYTGELGMNIIQHMYLAVDHDTEMACVAPTNWNPGPDEILEIGPGLRVPDSVGVFPETVTRYTAPTPLVTSVTSTQGAVRTTVPGMTVAGLAGLVFVM